MRFPIQIGCTRWSGPQMSIAEAGSFGSRIVLDRDPNIIDSAGVVTDVLGHRLGPAQRRTSWCRRRRRGIRRVRRRRVVSEGVAG